MTDNITTRLDSLDDLLSRAKAWRDNPQEHAITIDRARSEVTAIRRDLEHRPFTHEETWSKPAHIIETGAVNG